MYLQIVVQDFLHFLEAFQILVQDLTVFLLSVKIITT